MKSSMSIRRARFFTKNFNSLYYKNNDNIFGMMRVSVAVLFARNYDVMSPCNFLKSIARSLTSRLGLELLTSLIPS